MATTMMRSSSALLVLRTSPSQSLRHASLRASRPSIKLIEVANLSSRHSTLLSPRYSSSSAASTQNLETPAEAPQSQTRRASSPSPDPFAANPPHTTRHPPLALPERKPDTSTIPHLFAVGKAYLTFYKTGLKRIWTNTQLVRTPNPSSESPSTTPTTSTNPIKDENNQPLTPPSPGTRADFLLQSRWRHDFRRLPLFVLLLIVCGEMTPLVVLLAPAVVPFTCRIPAQVDKLLRQAEERRRVSVQAWGHALDASGGGATDGAGRGEGGGRPGRAELAHVGRVLDVSSRTWDRVGMDPPGWVVRRHVLGRVRTLVRDDQLLVRAGGVDALEDEEVRLACVDRGINVLGRKDEELRRALALWLDTFAYGGGEETDEVVHDMIRHLAARQ